MFLHENGMTFMVYSDGSMRKLHYAVWPYFFPVGNTEGYTVCFDVSQAEFQCFDAVGYCLATVGLSVLAEYLNMGPKSLRRHVGHGVMPTAQQVLEASGFNFDTGGLE